MIHSKRFSIRALMAVIVVVALGLAMVILANDISAGLLLLASVATVCFALMGSIILRGTERVWCAGYVFMGGVYLAVAFDPWLRDRFEGVPGTTQILEQAFSSIWPPTEVGTTQSEIAANWIARRSRLASFHRAGQSLFAVLAGLVGGTVAAWLYARRVRCDSSG
jgi:heme A synthase